MGYVAWLKGIKKRKKIPLNYNGPVYTSYYINCYVTKHDVMLSNTILQQFYAKNIKYFKSDRATEVDYLIINENFKND
jgi:hypothetical protein